MFGLGKGKIEIRLNKFNYAYGEEIEGIISLKLKKDLEGREVRVRLHAEETANRMMSSSRNNQNRRTIVFDFSQPLDGEKIYSSAQPIEYRFKIQLPNKDNESSSNPEGFLGAMVKVSQLARSTMKRTNWYITATFDTKGLDINKRLQINVN